jgi:hypothetical protein
MDWRQFFSGVVGSLAWPIVFGFTAWIFRSEIRHFLKNIKTFRAGGVSFDVANLIEQSGEKLENSAITQGKPSIERKLDYSLAEEFPEAAILNAYQDLSKTLLEIRGKLPDDRPHRNLIEVVNWLRKNGFVSDNIRESFLSLQQTTTLVRHSKGTDRVGPGEAIEIVRQMAVLKDIFEGVIDKIPSRKQI